MTLDRLHLGVARVRSRASGRAVARVPGRGTPAAGGGPPTIYNRASAAEVCAYAQALIATADDLTPAGGFYFDADGTDFIGGKNLIARNGATLAASPHGKAAVQVAGGAGWTVGDTSSFNVTSGAGQAVALLARFKVTAAPIADSVFIGKGTGISYYGGMIDTSGRLVGTARKLGGPGGVTATVAGSIADGVYRWGIPVGITRSSQKVYAAIAGAALAESAFLASDSVNNGVAFGFAALESTFGAVGVELDALFPFLGTPAENIYTHGAALLAALEAAE